MTAKLVVALDFASEQDALTLIDSINPAACALKVGSELFTLLGPNFIRYLVRQGYQVFLDLKFHDIPNTVAQACRSAADLGVWMLNVHASGGLAMMQAAKKALADYGQQRPLLIAVTVLTSMNAAELSTIGIHTLLEQHVCDLTYLAYQAGVDGVVCSAQEVPLIKTQCGQSFLTVTPGIRCLGDSLDDQSRVMTPERAKALGSDYLVVGRSITRALDPAQRIEAILQSLKSTLL